MKHLFAGLTLTLFFLPGSIALPQEIIATSSWEDIREKKRGTIAVYWYTSRPFIFANDNGEMDGIEYRIFESFKNHLSEKYEIALDIKWIKSKSFIDTFNDVVETDSKGVFGTSAFSITADRKEKVQFSPPYMPDISVMISSGDIPIITDPSMVKETFSGLTAVTIKGTTYEIDLLNLRREWNLDFEIKYISSSDNILINIAQTDKSFGFIDLPIYLMEFNRNTAINVKRQNLMPIVKREGYSIIFPKVSDWGEPMRAYFESEEFHSKMEEITSEFLDNNLYKFIEDLYLDAENNVVLLSKEKEMQYEEIQGKSEQLKRESLLRNYLITAVFLILVFMLITLLLYRKVNKDNKVLSEQAEKIMSQSRNIEVQKEQLEKRNERLLELDDEKNTLIKVLAHDLRSPINQIQGFASLHLLESKNTSNAQSDYIKKIVDTANRINGMIGKILDIDALESNRINVVFEEIDVAALTRQLVHEHEGDANKKNITLHFFSKTNGKSCAALDKFYLTQILENLISNAIKFSPPGKSVEVNVLDTSSSVKIQISDEGPGFTEEDKKYLFQKYRQLSAKPTSGEKSTGLGLSIVKKYIDLMGGKISCESTAGKGASFLLEFSKTGTSG